MNRKRHVITIVAAAILTFVAACTNSQPDSVEPNPTPTASERPTADIKSAPADLAEAVAARYGTSVTGTADLGNWGGDEIAVVTGTGDQDGDITLAADDGSGWMVIGGWWPSLGAQGDVDLGDPSHVLVLGSDARPGERVAASRADTIQLLGFDGRGGAGVMGFARDLWVPIAGRGHNKINSALVFGGPEAQVETVANVTDIPITGYVLTGFEGFTALIDAAGGLEFNAPRSIAGRKITIPQGPQSLSGDEALFWARERKLLPGGDFDRSRHQGLLLLAAADQLRFTGLDAAPKALGLVDQFTESNVSGADMLRFVAAFYLVDPANIGHSVAKGSFGVAGDDQSIVNLDEESRSTIRDFEDGAFAPTN